MPNNSVFDNLTEAEIAEIEAEIKQRNFKDYAGLVALLEERGFGISISSLWRRGKSMKDRLEAVKRSTEKAIAISKAVKDEGIDLSSATTSIIQEQLFNTINDYYDDGSLEINEKISMLSKAAKTASDLTKSQITLTEYKEKINARVAATTEKITQTAKSAGVSQETIAIIRRDLLGIVV